MRQVEKTSQQNKISFFINSALHKKLGHRIEKDVQEDNEENQALEEKKQKVREKLNYDILR